MSKLISSSSNLFQSCIRKPLTATLSLNSRLNAWAMLSLWLILSGPAAPQLCLPSHKSMLKPLLNHIASSLDPCDGPHHTSSSIFSFMLFQFVLFRAARMNYKHRLIISLCRLSPGRAFYKFWRKSTSLLRCTSSASSLDCPKALLPCRNELPFLESITFSPFPSANTPWFPLSAPSFSLAPGLLTPLSSFSPTFPLWETFLEPLSQSISFTAPPPLLHPFFSS